MKACSRPWTTAIRPTYSHRPHAPHEPAEPHLATHLRRRSFRVAFMNLTALPGRLRCSRAVATPSAPASSMRTACCRWRILERRRPTMANGGGWLTEPRLYHSVATFLPDGRVFISGGGSEPGVTESQDRAALLAALSLQRRAADDCIGGRTPSRTRASFFVADARCGEHRTPGDASRARARSRTRFDQQNARTLSSANHATHGRHQRADARERQPTHRQAITCCGSSTTRACR